jgi:hypothetical protein
MQTIAAAPALAVPAATPAQSPAPRPAPDAQKLETTTADAAAEMTPRFFTAAQFAALRKLSEMLMPPLNNLPGALEAKAAEFLDFLLSKSPAERQRLYRVGLDTLNAQAQKQFGKPFADLNETQAAELLAPLRQAWTYVPPTEPFARFLREAKADVRTATLNSYEYNTASAASGRRGGGTGQYWYPLD